MIQLHAGHPTPTASPSFADASVCPCNRPHPEPLAVCGSWRLLERTLDCPPRTRTIPNGHLQDSPWFIVQLRKDARTNSSFLISQRKLRAVSQTSRPLYLSALSALTANG